MRRIGCSFRQILSESTCQFNGRVFSFGRHLKRLKIREVQLGDRARVIEVDTHVVIGDDEELYILTCPLGEGVLVMVCTGKVTFAALFRFWGTRLGKGTFSMQELSVSGSMACNCVPEICRVDDRRALIYYKYCSPFLYVNLGRDCIWFSTVETDVFGYARFSSRPLLMPDGSIVGSSSNPRSTEIWRVWLDKEGNGQLVGNIPGRRRDTTSTALVANRFMVGFGGNVDEQGGDFPLGDLWVVDLQSGHSSTVRRTHYWHKRDDSVYLAVIGKYLYLVGGWRSSEIFRISLVVLSNRIARTKVRTAFQDAIGAKRTYMTLASYARKMAATVVVL